MNTKLTILYERLSREDERENESVSIENQKDFLEEYAIKNGFSNYIHLTDDGWSGTRWDRPGFMAMMDKIEGGGVQTILVKDMSRLGRDYLRVGMFLEQLREKGVRLIAVAEAIDTAKGEDDFMPFRNIIAEWHARDTSRKIKTIFGSRTAQGKHVTGAIPYGYLHDPNDRQKWILDEDAAPIVARVFASIINGKSVTQVAEELSADKILTPAAHWKKIGAGMQKPHNADPTKWSASSIINMVKKQEYMGWKVLNKTTRDTYKSKRKASAPEDILVFKGAYPAIVSEETWNVVQRLRETRRYREKIGGAPNPLTGILYCADCGQKMYHKQGNTGRPNQPHQEYVCSSYRHYSRSCTCHYIRVSVIQNLILAAIRRTCGYVRENEAAFVERLRKESVIRQDAAIKESRKKHANAQRRREEISGFIKKLYESYAADKIPEKQFAELLAGYGSEQEQLDREIAELQTAIDSYNADSVRADKFIALVKKHTEFSELSAGLLNEFIEKVIVHEAQRINGVRTMEVDIYLNFIGKFELPELEQPQEETPIRKSKKKLRRDMTEEELRRAREIDQKYYAKKVAARKAAEETERAAILQGTSFELPPQKNERTKIA